MGSEAPLFPLLALSRLRMESDGAGVTTLVAGAGCTLGCKYCINARLLKEKPPEWIAPEELLGRTRIDNLYFQATGGGLCFGGGEALLHADFIAAFRALIGSAWKLTAETALCVPPEALETAIGALDAFIVDIKTADPGIYRSYTGKDNALALQNLQTLFSRISPDRVKVRVPLIPGYNDEADRQKTVALLQSLGAEDIELFTYKTP
jgi:pyruvate formate lyase activating enzyme